MQLEFAESGCPFSRAAIPLSRGQLKSKGHDKPSILFSTDKETIETVFRIIVSANQPSLYGAVVEIFEEYQSLHEKTGRLVVMGQSCSMRSRQKFFWIVMIQRSKIFYWNNTKNEFRSCHNKTN